MILFAILFNFQKTIWVIVNNRKRMFTITTFLIKTSGHPVQVPRWDAPNWLLLLIMLLKVVPGPKIIPPRPVNENVFYPGHSIIVLGLRHNFATYLMKLRYKSSAMDTWYLISLVILLNWPAFLNTFQLLVSCNNLNWNQLWISLN